MASLRFTECDFRKGRKRILEAILEEVNFLVVVVVVVVFTPGQVKRRHRRGLGLRGLDWGLRVRVQA